jgi:transposase InsO family protein
MIDFIDDHRGSHGVEPICQVLPIAPSTYHAHAAQRRDPAKQSLRAQRDRILKPEITRVFAENFAVYGARKVWRQLGREGTSVARCTVERLMKEMGLQGVIRGKPVRTTISDKAAPCPLDHVNRQFHAPRPNALWVSDFTYVASWTGVVYVAFIIDTFARRIVGWRASRTAHTSFVLDALEQALHDRQPVHRGGLISPQRPPPSMSRSNTPSVWRKRVSSLPSVVSAIPTTMPSRKPSMGFIRPR